MGQKIGKQGKGNEISVHMKHRAFVTFNIFVYDIRLYLQRANMGDLDRFKLQIARRQRNRIRTVAYKNLKAKGNLTRFRKFKIN